MKRCRCFVRNGGICFESNRIDAKGSGDAVMTEQSLPPIAMIFLPVWLLSPEVSAHDGQTAKRQVALDDICHEDGDAQGVECQVGHCS